MSGLCEAGSCLMKGPLGSASPLVLLLICAVRSKPPTIVDEVSRAYLRNGTTVPYIKPLGSLTGGIPEEPRDNKPLLFYIVLNKNSVTTAQNLHVSQSVRSEA